MEDKPSIYLILYGDGIHRAHKTEHRMASVTGVRVWARDKSEVPIRWTLPSPLEFAVTFDYVPAQGERFLVALYGTMRPVPVRSHPAPPDSN